MTVEELRNALTSYKGYVSSKTRKAIERILALSWKYQYIGARFEFSANAELSAQVEKILRHMTDELYDYSFRKARTAADKDDDDNSVLVMLDADNIRQRYYKHTDHLKTMLEVYIGTAFANKYTRGELLSKVAAYIANPPVSFHFGRGVMRNPAEAYTVIGQNTIHTAYQSSVLIGYRKDPMVIGYRVVRGSNYDCDECQSLVGITFPLSSQVLPVHPRCRCYTTPVYIGKE